MRVCPLARICRVHVVGMPGYVHEHELFVFS